MNEHLQKIFPSSTRKQSIKNNKISIQVAQQEIARQWAKRSCLHFIRQYVKIEDRDAPGLSVPFELWPRQEDALQSFLDNRLIISLKARQLGLTWLALSYALWRMLFTSGYYVVAISKREDPDVKELVRRMKFSLRHLPDWMIQQKSSKGQINTTTKTWDGGILSISIEHPQNEPSVFQSMTAAPDSGRSFTANLVILDEWAFHPYAEEIWSAAYPTINRPTGGQVIGLSTMARATLFEEIWRTAGLKENSFKQVFLPWNTDPRRCATWREATKRDLPATWRQEYPETEEEAMSAGADTALPEFSRQVHVCTPFLIPDWWERWIAHDPGYNNPFAWYWLAVNPDGIVYVYREYTQNYGPTEPKIFYSDQAAKVRALSTKDEKTGELENINYVVAGRDAFAKSRETGKTYVDYYREGGIPWGFNEPNTDRRLRLGTWHEYLKPFSHPEKTTAKLQIFGTCTALIETLPQLLLDENDREKVADNPKIDNAYDAIGYGLIYWHTRASKAPEAPLTGDAKRIHDHIEGLVRKRKNAKIRRHMAGGRRLI